jgi:hypothetical protein
MFHITEITKENSSFASYETSLRRGYFPKGLIITLPNRKRDNGELIINNLTPEEQETLFKYLDEYLHDSNETYAVIKDKLESTEYKLEKALEEIDCLREANQRLTFR